MVFTKSSIIAITIVMSTAYPCKATQTDQGVSESWYWKCGVVTSTESICDVSSLSSDGVELYMFGGSELSGPMTRPIEFLSDEIKMSASVDGKSEYRAESFPPKSLALVREMLSGETIQIHPNGEYMLGFDSFTRSLKGFKRAYCAAITFLTAHTTPMHVDPRQADPPGVSDDSCTR